MGCIITLFFRYRLELAYCCFCYHSETSCFCTICWIVFLVVFVDCFYPLSAHSCAILVPISLLTSRLQTYTSFLFVHFFIWLFLFQLLSHSHVTLPAIPLSCRSFVFLSMVLCLLFNTVPFSDPATCSVFIASCCASSFLLLDTHLVQNS